jgi:hypothetical protein
MKIDQKPYLLWSPITWDQASFQSTRYKEVFDLNGFVRPDLAEWNLNWLFDYEHLSRIAPSDRAWGSVYKDMKVGVQASISADLEDNKFNLKELAETLTPTAFISSYIRKPYSVSFIYKLWEDNYGPGTGDKIFEQARINAPKLEAVMLGEAEIDERGIPIPVPPERRRPRLDRPPERTGNVIQVPFRRK